MTTAGNLVFQGRVDGSLRAYTADAGKEVWRRDLGLGISAPPITYAVNGKQYVAILVGWGGAMAGLGGLDLRRATAGRTACTRAISWRSRSTARRRCPVQPPPTFATPLKADFTVTPAQAQVGAELYARCTACHGPGAVAAGMAPDLRASFVVTSGRAVHADPARRSRARRAAMPTYADITDQELTRAAALHPAASGGGPAAQALTSATA